MAIDAKIVAVRRAEDKTTLTLAPRRQSDGTLSIAGRRQLFITKNPDYEPQVGDEIWGNANQVMIREHSFRRIMELWNGTFEVL